MARLILWRVATAIVTLAFVAVLVFAATQALPGDAARAALGQSATPQRLAALRAELHLDEPTTKQFVDWFGGFLHGHLGTSLESRRPVSQVVSDRLGRFTFLVVGAPVVRPPAA